MNKFAADYLYFVFAEKRIDPFCKSLLLDVESFVSQGSNSALFEVKIIFRWLLVRIHLRFLESLCSGNIDVTLSVAVSVVWLIIQ